MRLSFSGGESLVSLLQRFKRGVAAFLYEPKVPPDEWWEHATEDDVYYCYRLLLNRKPDPAGWAQHCHTAASRNISLQTLVAQFLMSTEFRLRRSVRISSWSKPKRIAVDGLQLYVGPPDSLVVQALENGSLEPHVKTELQRLLRPGMTVVDVGANLGYLTLVAARQVGDNGRVLAFEPNQFNCTLIYMNAHINRMKNIEVFPFAAGASNGTSLYQDLMGNGRVINSITQVDHVEADDLDHITSMNAVRTVTLDYALQSELRIDLLKIDVEGGEHLVLKGAGEILRQHRPTILTEFSLEGLEMVSGVSGQEFLKLLTDANYDLSAVDEDAGVTPLGQDIDGIIARHRASRTNHIDVLATPR